MNSEKESEEQVKAYRNGIFAGQSERTENSETVTETLTLRFDTSLTDSTSGRHPVKEMSKTVVTQGKAVRATSSGEIESNRTDSATIRSREKTAGSRTESLRQQTSAVSKTSRWLYSSVALIILLAVSGWFFKRKIKDFFL